MPVGQCKEKGYDSADICPLMAWSEKEIVTEVSKSTHIDNFPIEWNWLSKQIHTTSLYVILADGSVLVEGYKNVGYQIIIFDFTYDYVICTDKINIEVIMTLESL